MENYLEVCIGRYVRILWGLPIKHTYEYDMIIKKYDIYILNNFF